jgi:hypothetical protein
MPANYSRDDLNAAIDMTERLFRNVSRLAERSLRELDDGDSWHPLEASEIFTADVESALERLAHQCALARYVGGGVPSIRLGEYVVPVDIGVPPGFWRRPRGPGREGYLYYRFFVNEPRITLGEGVGVSSVEEALKMARAAAQEFLAVRDSPTSPNGQGCSSKSARKQAACAFTIRLPSS